jgi:hypothetical protein
MKKILLFAVIMLLMFIVNCNGQPKSDYEIYSSPVTGAAKYHFFLEKKSAAAYKLVQGMDYLNPNVSTLKVGEATTPVFTINLNNDGSEYTVGIVAENSAGYYSGMGVAIGTVGTVPSVPAGIGLRKK